MKAALKNADRTFRIAEVERVKGFTSGRGADVVFECAGGESMPMTLPQATKMDRRGGKVGVIGGFDQGEATIPNEWQRIETSEIQNQRSASFACRALYAEQGMVVDLIGSGELDLGKLITQRFKLDQTNGAFETARRKQHTGPVFVAISIK
jgi:L-iditol 2-dehydrogenase